MRGTPAEARSLPVSVTQEDIAHGERKAAGICPVALAISRVCPDMLVLVTFAAACLSLRVRESDTSTYPTRVLLPQEARDFIRRFDAGRTVRPFTFDLEMP